VEFIHRHRHDCLVVLVYLAEAHFVERDEATGEFKEGWPIGYYEYEYAQHKNLKERRDMAIIASKELKCMSLADEVVLDSCPGNHFLQYFGAWPDQAFAFDAGGQGRLEFRGNFTVAMQGAGGGDRGRDFASQLERFWRQQEMA